MIDKPKISVAHSLDLITVSLSSGVSWSRNTNPTSVAKDLARTVTELRQDYPVIEFEGPKWLHSELGKQGALF
jgi:hypothetical protein